MAQRVSELAWTELVKDEDAGEYVYKAVICPKDYQIYRYGEGVFEAKGNGAQAARRDLARQLLQAEQEQVFERVRQRFHEEDA